jgi:hypothetical protein
MSVNVIMRLSVTVTVTVIVTVNIALTVNRPFSSELENGRCRYRDRYPYRYSDITVSLGHDRNRDMTVTLKSDHYYIFYERFTFSKYFLNSIINI